MHSTRMHDDGPALTRSALIGGLFGVGRGFAWLAAVSAFGFADTRACRLSSRTEMAAGSSAMDAESGSGDARAMTTIPGPAGRPGADAFGAKWRC